MNAWLRRWSFFAFLVLASLSAGCTSASIQANRDPNFSQRLSRLVLLVGHPGEPEEAEELRAAIASGLKAHGVTLRSYVVSEESAPEVEELESFGPEAVLLVIANSTTTQMFERVKVGYDVSLVLSGPEKKRIWRGVLEHSGDSLLMSTRIEKAADELVNKLVEDRLIASR